MCAYPSLVYTGMETFIRENLNKEVSFMGENKTYSLLCSAINSTNQSYQQLRMFMSGEPHIRKANPPSWHLANTSSEP